MLINHKWSQLTDKAFSALMLTVGQQKGHLAHKKLCFKTHLNGSYWYLKHKNKIIK